MLEGLLKTPGLIGMASGKLKAYFEKEGTDMITIRIDPECTEPPLPGFRIEFYREPTVIVSKEAHQRNEAIRASHPYAITPEENAEYENLKLLKASQKI